MVGVDAGELRATEGGDRILETAVTTGRPPSSPRRTVVSVWNIFDEIDMDVKAFTFNSGATYTVGLYTRERKVPDLTKLQIVVKADGSAFPASFPDAIFRSYVLPPVMKE